MPRLAPRKLTEAFVKALPLGEPALVRDTKVTGLLLAVNKRSKTYKVQRDLWRGQRGRRQLVKTVRHTLGTTDELTLEQARLKAEDVIRQIKLGIDPNEPLAEQKAEGWTVDILFDEYAADMRKRECAERTIVDVLARRDRYLPDWKKLPLTSLTRSMVRAKHKELSETRGKVTANHMMRDFRAAYNLALRIIDNPDLLPDNPVKAVTFNKERRKNAVIHPDDLPDWWEKIQALPNPLRRTMHEFGLFSGLRPGTLVALRRDWIKLEGPRHLHPEDEVWPAFRSAAVEPHGRAGAARRHPRGHAVPRLAVAVPDPRNEGPPRASARNHPDPGLARENAAQRNRAHPAPHLPHDRAARVPRQDRGTPPPRSHRARHRRRLHSRNGAVR